MLKVAQMLVRIAAALIGVVAITILMALTFPRSARAHLRACGHTEDCWDRLSKITRIRFGPTHCCTSGSMICRLHEIQIAQEVYLMDHGKYASSLDQISN